MKSGIVVVVFLAAAVCANSGFAADEAKPVLNQAVANLTLNQEVTVPATENRAQQLVMVDNKICPVSGEKIVAGKEAKFEYKGKVYNMCCPMCEKDFRKNPEAFVKKIEAGIAESQGEGMKMPQEGTKASN